VPPLGPLISNSKIIERITKIFDIKLYCCKVLPEVMLPNMINNFTSSKFILREKWRYNAWRSQSRIIPKLYRQSLSNAAMHTGCDLVSTDYILGLVWIMDMNIPVHQL
jgi:hypothetical protein